MARSIQIYPYRKPKKTPVKSHGADDRRTLTCLYGKHSAIRYSTDRRAAKLCFRHQDRARRRQVYMNENGEEIENYWYAGYICNAQEEPLYTLVVLEETAGEMHVPQAFRKIGEALVDFN